MPSVMPRIRSSSLGNSGPLMSFTSGPEFPKELDRILGITEGIMRSMIVCKGE